MVDLSATSPASVLRRLDRVWATAIALLLAVAIFDLPEFWPVVVFAGSALGHTAIFIIIAVAAVAYMKATGAESLLAKAFQGNQARMIVFAALLGGLSPFCSCEVIPFIAAMLALGAPLGAVMAFWLASPLMDPAMFAITAGRLGFDFALAKTVAAVSLGLFGGFATMALVGAGLLPNPLREKPQVGGCCGAKRPFEGKPVWRFWGEADRRSAFRDSALENGAFLLKWMTLAYVIEALMVTYIPADLIADALGGQGIGTIFLGALVGAPAYLNGYAAVGLIGALLDQGMSNGAAMSFMIAGGVSSIPAALAVWALVRPRIFIVYLSLAVAGATIAGLIWQVVS
ncbi:MAG: permease [Pseudomonadota bacterium]